MLNKITVGKYVYGNSRMHRWNPVIKLVCSFGYVIALFSTNGWFFSILLGVILFFFLVQSDIRMKIYFQPIWQMRYMLLFLFFFYIVVGMDLFQNGLLLYKMVVVLLYSSMVLYTTSIRDLIDAISFLLYPLTWLHIPVSLLAHMMGLALSFFPNLLLCANQILKSMYARGMDYRQSCFRQKIQIWNSLLHSLMDQSFRYADAIANTMEVRLYLTNPDQKRKFTFDWFDWFCLLFHVFLILLVRKEGVLCAI